jgi:hypothetical protein
MAGFLVEKTRHIHDYLQTLKEPPMKIFSYLAGILGKSFASEATAQDSNLPLHINFKTTVTFEVNPILSAITQGAMLNIQLDNLKVLKVKAISSLKIEGMDNKKFYRFYFPTSSTEKRLFLQILCDSDNVETIDEILLCSSRTEPPASDADIAFFLGDGETGLGESSYHFSRDDLCTFLPSSEVDKRLAVSGADGVDYQRIDPEQVFMPAFTGVETVIFDAYGTTGESRRIMNIMPHSRALSENRFEELLVAFWVTNSNNGKDISIRNQLPLAEYIFAIKLAATNIKVI